VEKGKREREKESKKERRKEKKRRKEKDRSTGTLTGLVLPSPCVPDYPTFQEVSGNGVGV